ncbi:OMA1 Metalloendopeptidase, partial [Nothocercus julius]|nr:OMA1 Metalloendopeptidase [Nothocercus julius]
SKLERCQRLNLSGNTGNWKLTGSTNYYGNSIDKGQRCLLDVVNTEVCKKAHHGSARSRFLSSQPLVEKIPSLHIDSLGQLPNRFSTWNVPVIRFFHISPSFQAAPAPLFWIIIKPAQKLFAIILGRSIRKWWKSLPPNKQELFKESARKNKWKILLSVSSLGILFIVFYFTHLEETPITGRARLLVFGKEHFRELSQIEYEMWMAEFKNKMLPETDARYQVVERVVGHLSESNKDIPQVSEQKWVVHVVEEPGINAFVLPVLCISNFFVLLVSSSGTHKNIMVFCPDRAGKTFFSALHLHTHTHQLFLPNQSPNQTLQCYLVCICPKPRNTVLMCSFQFIFDRPYSRTLEAEADKVGLQFAAKACVDVRASSVFWQQMELAETIQGQPKMPEWLSTHPSHENRAEHLDRLIPE